MKETFEKNQAYEKDSIILNMNPNDYYSGSSTYYISTDYKIMPDKTYQDVDYSEDIAQAYLSYLTSSECLGFVQSKLTGKIPVKYLSELIRVNLTGRVLTIKVVGDTSERTTEILNALSDAVNAYKQEVDTKIHEHRLDLMEYSEVENTSASDVPEVVADQTPAGLKAGSDNYVADFQKQFSDSQISLTNQIASFYNNYTSLADKKVSTDSSAAVGNIAKSVNTINGDETVKATGDIITDAAAINAIRDVKYILLAADRNTAKKDLRTQLEKLKGLKKHVAGILLFD